MYIVYFARSVMWPNCDPCPLVETGDINYNVYLVYHRWQVSVSVVRLASHWSALWDRNVDMHFHCPLYSEINVQKTMKIRAIL